MPGAVFLLPFGHRHSLLGSSCSHAGVQRSSRSAHRDNCLGPAWGFHVPHAQDPAGEGAAYTPGRRCSRDRQVLRTPSAASQRPALHPGHASIHPGLTLTRCHRRFTHVHPSGLLLARTPRMDHGTHRLSPELRTPPLPAAHVRAETGHRTRTRATSSTSPPTSYSTRYLRKRPRVAPP